MSLAVCAELFSDSSTAVCMAERVILPFFLGIERIASTEGGCLVLSSQSDI